MTSPRFFSAFRGATDDVRLCVRHLRESYVAQGTPLAVLGWSNGGSIVNNLLAEQATTHANDEGSHVCAAASLACPLDMVANSENLKRWFHRSVYDRAIAGSLASKFQVARGLFEDGSTGSPKPVPRWEGLAELSGGIVAPSAEGGSGKFTADVELASTTSSIRGIDEALTAPCFGFGSVDEYYRHASSAQRLGLVDRPLLILSAYDDPIALGSAIPLGAGRENTHGRVLVAVTAMGGHLGWCDREDPWGAPAWVERASLGFLEAALDFMV